MEKIFLFDVDGTLTPSRCRMNEEFKQLFINFQLKHSTYLVTGSDFDKTFEQVGWQIIFSSKLTFHCSGNECRNQAKIVYRNEWEPPKQLLAELVLIIADDPYDVRTGNHIEFRTGSINFSVVGRNATSAQREHYKHYDRAFEHRKDIVGRLSEKFPDISFQIGGETGIDIFPKGYDKRQVITYLPKAEIYFFGDAVHDYGNDQALAHAVYNLKGKVYGVKDWRETMEILERDHL